MRHDEPLSRLIIDLPGHHIAPGVRSLEVFRGGVTGIHPLPGPEQAGSQVEIGLVPSRHPLLVIAIRQHATGRHPT